LLFYVISGKELGEHVAGRLRRKDSAGFSVKKGDA
jgi:hypothetical protein